MFAQHGRTMLREEIPQILAFQFALGDEAGEVVAVAEDPRLTHRTLYAKRSPAISLQLPSAPQTVLKNGFEAQWVQAHA